MLRMGGEVGGVFAPPLEGDHFRIEGDRWVRSLSERMMPGSSMDALTVASPSIRRTRHLRQ